MESGIFYSVFICKECIAFISQSEEQIEQQIICSSKLFSANICSKKFSRDIFLRSPNAWGPRSRFL